MKAIKGEYHLRSSRITLIEVDGGQVGVLLKCDSAVKQILLTMNEKESFIIDDLDDAHVLIKADEEYRVRRELEIELEKNTYSMDV